MKLKDLKHNHSLTDLLKVLIFSILMLLPFIAVGTRCLYVICNKNAYQSAEITTTTYERQEINNIYRFNFYDNDENAMNDLYTGYIRGNLYGWNLSSLRYSEPIYSDETYTDDNNFSIMKITYDFTCEESSSAFLVIYIGGDNYYIDLCFDGIINLILDININETDLPLDELISKGFLQQSPIQYYEYQEVEATTLDNVFEYSINKLENSELFTWTQNTAVYTGINAMTTSLQIQGTAIPMLITYWFLLSVIYIILDIVLKLFTILTHLIGSKTT